jgi:FkbM family methyltransferase
MEWIEDQLNHAPVPSAIVHLGAGLCRELPHYIGSGAGRIILFEPNPEVIPALRRQAEGHSNVEVFPVAVAAESGRRALKLYNYDDLASLRRPTGLFELLPGLQHIGQAIVDVMAAHNLASELSLEIEENNWLVIDTPGEEAAIISALEQHRKLHHFDRIIIRAGAESLYDGAQSAEQLTRQLEQLGYYIEGAKDTSDCDWPRYHLRLNPKAIECRRLRRENEALTEQKTKLEEQNQELTEQLQRQMDRATECAEELESAQKQTIQQQRDLATQNEDIKEKLEELDGARKHLSDLKKREAEKSRELEVTREERDTLRQKLEQVEKKHAEETVGLKDKLATAKEEHEATRQRLSDVENREAERSKELEAATKERDSTREKLETAQKNLNNLEARETEKNKELESLQDTNSRLKEELSKARDEAESQRADLGIALRLQALRESDLTELQKRFAEVQEVKNQQQELLGKLHQRLSVAAKYLSLESDESNPGQVREELVQALSGDQSERE